MEAAVLNVNEAQVSVTDAARPVWNATIPGSTQQFDLNANALWSSAPIFFAPGMGDKKEMYDKVWEVVVRSVARSVYYSFLRTVPSKNSLSWDRLTLELMRISTLESNWDNEGADAISHTAKIKMTILLSLARKAAESATSECSLPTVYPSVDGSVILKWIRAGKELKCTVLEDEVEVVRWQSSDAYESDGLWVLPVENVAEHFEWLLR